MANVKLDFEHKAIIAIIFLALFGFFFFVLGITFTALGYTSTYALFRWMGPVMAGIALVMIILVCVLGYKVSVARTKSAQQRHRQMAILQKASTMRMKGPYAMQPEVPGHYAYAGAEEPTYANHGVANPAYHSSQGYLPKQSVSSEQARSDVIPTVKQPTGQLSPAGYSAYPAGPQMVPESLNSSHSSLAGVPALAPGVTPYYSSATSPAQIEITTQVIEASRPRRPVSGRPASGSSLPQ